MRRRNLLHRTKFDEFLSWAAEQGYEQQPIPKSSIYEAARLRPPGGGNPVIIYERLRGEHYTVHGEALTLVEAWLANRNVTPENSEQTLTP